MTFLIDIKESISKDIACALDSSVSWKPIQIGLHPQNAICPGTWTGKCKCRRDGSLKEPSGRTSQARISRMSKHLPQRPQCAPMTVIRPHIFNPLAVVTEKVSKPPGIGMKCKP